MTANGYMPLITPQERLLLLGSNTRQVLVAASAGPTFLYNIPIERLNGAAVSTDGRLFFLTETDELKVWDVRSGHRSTLGKLKDVLHVHGDWPSPLAVSPDGRRLIIAYSGAVGSGAAHEAAAFWRSVLDARTGTLLARIPSEPELVKTSAAPACLIPQMLIASDNRTLAELCFWGGPYPLLPAPTFRKVDFVEQKVMGSLPLPGGSVAALAPDGQRWYALSEGGALFVVDARHLTVIEQKKLDGAGFAAGSWSLRLAVAPNGRYLFASANQRVSGNQLNGQLNAVALEGWRITSQTLTDELIQDIAVSADGRSVYVLTSKRLVAFDAADLRERGAINWKQLFPADEFDHLFVVASSTTQALLPQTGERDDPAWLVWLGLAVVMFSMAWWVRRKLSWVGGS